MGLLKSGKWICIYLIKNSINSFLFLEVLTLQFELSNSVPKKLLKFDTISPFTQYSLPSYLQNIPSIMLNPFKSWLDWSGEIPRNDSKWGFDNSGYLYLGTRGPVGPGVHGVGVEGVGALDSVDEVEPVVLVGVAIGVVLVAGLEAVDGV